MYYNFRELQDFDYNRIIVVDRHYVKNNLRSISICIYNLIVYDNVNPFVIQNYRVFIDMK